MNYEKKNNDLVIFYRIYIFTDNLIILYNIDINISNYYLNGDIFDRPPISPLNMSGRSRNLMCVSPENNSKGNIRKINMEFYIGHFKKLSLRSYYYNNINNDSNIKIAELKKT
ncbi:hypothetical protein H8356DRAFT_1363374 [Neocallimastix lanati (nom. inval.)]|nr:hypothetical protein H8356DRAFT_1363374 [Neocallimastix sp. JGI-2020a]